MRVGYKNCEKYIKISQLCNVSKLRHMHLFLKLTSILFFSRCCRLNSTTSFSILFWPMYNNALYCFLLLCELLMSLTNKLISHNVQNSVFSDSVKNHI